MFTSIWFLLFMTTPIVWIVFVIANSKAKIGDKIPWWGWSSLKVYTAFLTCMMWYQLTVSTCNNPEADCQKSIANMVICSGFISLATISIVKFDYQENK